MDPKANTTTKNFLNDVLRQAKAAAMTTDNPFRAAANMIDVEAEGVRDHNTTCKKCKTPGPKATAALQLAQERTVKLQMSFLTALRQDTEAVFADRKRFDETARNITGRAVASCAITAAYAVGNLAAQIHDENPDLSALDQIKELLAPLADLWDATKASANKTLN